MTYTIAEETVEQIHSGGAGDYEFEVLSGDVRLGRTKSEAVNGRRYKAGDRGEITVPNSDEEVWAYCTRGTAEISYQRAGFFVNLFPRYVTGSVQTSDGNEAAPASDAYVWRYDTAADCNAATISEEMEVPDRADEIAVHVDDATGAFDVTVSFLDGLGGNVLTERGPSDDAGYAGDSATDVFTVTTVASPFVRVEIEDTSGAQNEVDYTMYAR